MLLDSVRNLLRRHAQASQAPQPVSEPAPLLVPDIALATDDDAVWSSARIGVAEALWGEGFLFPGGVEETLRLATPLGLSAATSLLLLGSGSGGAARCISTELGGWVTGYEANAHLVSVANERNQRAGLGKRAQAELWDPAAPLFPPRYFHHAVALEPLQGAPPAPILGAISRALKPAGQFVLVEVVADLPLDPDEAMVVTWSSLAHRPASLPSELGITRKLGELGFDVRIAEDVTQRHLRYTIRGWRDAVRTMRRARPTLPQLALVVREAELWLARVRLMRSGRLRLVRWHAISRAGGRGGAASA